MKQAADNNTQVARQRRSLRRELRAARARISPLRRQIETRATTRHLCRLAAHRNTRHIAVTLPIKGELCTLAFIDWCWSSGKQVYLPRLDGALLSFLPFRRGDRLERGSFGLSQPRGGGRKRRPVASLDLVVLPLLGFDQCGTRLGFGGGYYDRTLAAQRAAAAVRGPLIIGAGFERQRVPRMQRMWWDVPLRAVVTSRGIRWFARSASM